jgi:hypothetical protein
LRRFAQLACNDVVVASVRNAGRHVAGARSTLGAAAAHATATATALLRALSLNVPARTGLTVASTTRAIVRLRASVRSAGTVTLRGRTFTGGAARAPGLRAVARLAFRTRAIATATARARPARTLLRDGFLLFAHARVEHGECLVELPIDLPAPVGARDRTTAAARAAGRP